MCFEPILASALIVITSMIAIWLNNVDVDAK